MKPCFSIFIRKTTGIERSRSSGDLRAIYQALMDGPSAMRDYIKQQTIVEPQAALPVHEQSAGAIGLDPERRQLRWFGVGDELLDVPLRRAFIQLVGRRWPGWDIAWETQGRLGIAHWAGCRQFRPTQAAAPVRVPSLTSERGPMDVLVTVRHPDGYTVAHAVDWVRPIDALLSPSTEWLKQAQRLVGLPYWQRPRCMVPTGGVHLDTETRTIYAWQASPVFEPRVLLRGASHGWQSVWWHDRYEAHLALTTKTIAWRPRDVHELQRSIMMRIRTGRDLGPPRATSTSLTRPRLLAPPPRSQPRQSLQVAPPPTRRRFLDQDNRAASRY